MARAVTVMPVRLARRMCLACGFRGRAIQSASRETVWACPRCGTDLYARPPRSYAELEALSDSNPGTPIDAELLTVPPRQSLHSGVAAMVSRWCRPLHGTRVAVALLSAAALFAFGLWLGRMI